MRSKVSTDGQERTFTEEARRAQIIACAIEVLAEVGYAQTSFARIAERAGISKSVISYHFAGKDELLNEVVRAVYTLGAQYMAPKVAAEPSGSAALAAYLRANLEFIRDNGPAIAAATEILVNVRSRAGAPTPVGGRPGLEATLGAVQDILRRGQAQGEFAEFDTRTMAWTIRTVIDGVNRQRALDPEFDFDAAIEEYLALFDRATRRAES